VGQDAGTSLFLGNELAGVTETPVFASAQSYICPNASATFTIPAQCGRFPLTYTWTLSGNLQFSNGQTTASGVSLNSQVIYGTSPGNGQVTVVASQQGLAPSAPLVYYVNVFAPEPVGTYYANDFNTKPLQTVNFVTTPTQISMNITGPAASYTFTSNSSAIPVSGGRFYLPANTGVQITVTAGSSASYPCGSTANFTFAPGGPRFAFAPNPASSELVVTATDQPSAAADGLSGAPVTSPSAPLFDAELYDGYGRKVKTQHSDRGKAVLDVRDLPAGLYNLRAGKGKEALSEHVQITH